MNIRDAEVPREKPNLELELDDEWETPLAPPPSRPIPPASDTFPAEEPPTLPRSLDEAELLILRLRCG